ncbi:Sensory sigma-54 dependent transcriptional regulator [Nitrospira sp. KM1]|nr:Sensory sigma-54 dependent transcriptional regulator [Nitrospira sp. KM1]
MVRIETISQLGAVLSDRIAIMDRQFNITYMNGPAESGAFEELKEVKLGKCYETFTRRLEPCESCPAVRMFDHRDPRSGCCDVTLERAACGLYQAFPLLTGQGQVGSMLALFEPRSGKPSIGPASKSRPVSPGMAGESLGKLIGRSDVMQRMFDLIRVVADTSATVLIEGESGTGKELVARTIHESSPRAGKPFVVVDCGSLPETLLESELFGHVKGAFTGAVANKRGLFEEADGGTIFLDELADTSPVFQAKLLRVLQEGEIKPVGGMRPVKIDVRIVSATNRDLVPLVKAKRFRQDLYYRLAVLPLCVPPLRDRREDIPLLVNHFLEESSRRHWKPVARVSPQVLRMLTDAAWPGNVRELQHYIERAVVTAPDDLQVCSNASITLPASSLRDLRSKTRETVKEVERACILQALDSTQGNRTKAAKLLKISRASLYNKLRFHCIS